MKVKIGDLTVRQLAEICNSHTNSHTDCKGCPFNQQGFSLRCKIAVLSTKTYLDFKIDLPDEEESENGKTYL